MGERPVIRQPRDASRKGRQANVLCLYHLEGGLFPGCGERSRQGDDLAEGHWVYLWGALVILRAAWKRNAQVGNLRAESLRE